VAVVKSCLLLLRRSFDDGDRRTEGASMVSATGEVLDSITASTFVVLVLLEMLVGVVGSSLLFLRRSFDNGDGRTSCVSMVSAIRFVLDAITASTLDLLTTSVTASSSDVLTPSIIDSSLEVLTPFTDWWKRVLSL
jgi:hypothetical protein